MANVNEAAQKYSSLGTCIQKQPEEKMIVIHSFFSKISAFKIFLNLVFSQMQK